MRFLSLSRPWPWAFTTEELPPLERKLIENRSWMPPISQIGERIALHAAKSWDDDAIRFFLGLGLQNMPGRKELYPSGVVFAVATIERVVTEARTLPAASRAAARKGCASCRRMSIPSCWKQLQVAQPCR